MITRILFLFCLIFGLVANAQFPKSPNSLTCMKVKELLNIGSLKRCTIASSQAIVNGWHNEQVLIFRNVKRSLTVPIKAYDKTTLEIGYVSGESYTGFDVYFDGDLIGQTVNGKGDAAPQVLTVNIPGSGVISWVPLIKNKPLAIYYLNPRLPSFTPISSKQWNQLGDGEYECYYYNSIPFFMPVFKVESDCGFELIMNDKLFLKSDKAACLVKAGKNANNYLIHIKLKIDNNDLDAVKLSTTSLQGGFIQAVKPDFMINKSQTEDWPKCVLSNGQLKATVALPCQKSGYYRSQRFEPAGIVTSLKFGEYEFMAKNVDNSRNPLALDHVGGLVEEFWDVLGDGNADTNREFFKIGNGVYRSLSNKPYFFDWMYQPVKRFGWQTKKVNQRCIEFTQKVPNWNGWGYIYKKTICLAENKPELTIKHELINIGKKRIYSSHYNHNFLQIDKQPLASGYELEFGFTPHFTRRHSHKRLMKRGDRSFVIKGNHKLFTPVWGCDNQAQNTIKLTHKARKAAVEIVNSFAPCNISLYISENAICPESFFSIDIGPGETTQWTRSYIFTRR